MNLETAAAFLADRHQGVLLTLKRDGRPHGSNIAFSFADGAARISVTTSRAKTRNLQRDPRASLHVTTSDFWQWVVIEGDAELTPPTQQSGDPAGLLLRSVYEHVSGKPHPDWDEFDAAMIADERLVVVLRPTRAYGQIPS